MSPGTRGELILSNINKREFLKISGVLLFGLGSGALLEVLSPGEALNAEEYIADPEALKANSWGMVIDLKIVNEKIIARCIKQCHQIHNVPDIPDKKREIKWIWGELFKSVFPDKGFEYFNIRSDLGNKTIPVFCNHCKEPPCVRVCPTKATFKRPDGIVMMDMHRCIGCRFCMAACPYGSRSFNWMDPKPYINDKNMEYPAREKGVVEKCDFCVERIDKGLQPACVEVSEGSFHFGDLNNPESEVVKLLRTRYTIRRKPELGTVPQIYYLI